MVGVVESAGIVIVGTWHMIPNDYRPYSSLGRAPAIRRDWHSVAQLDRTLRRTSHVYQILLVDLDTADRC